MNSKLKSVNEFYLELIKDINRAYPRIIFC